ncbi:MAG: type I restriction enzyme HsdR N-terminal domain-containing protein [Desulfobacterales bacterium]|nr:type I restriction enzyme HsdR N-terminal domain-containing protein [Desulfobacterales bacterium]
MKNVCHRFKQFEEKLKSMDEKGPAPSVEKQVCTLIDYLTGKEIADIGAEANRQAVLRFLVEEKGYAREDIETNVPIAFEVKGEPCRSRADVVVSAGGRRLIAIKCAAGSLGSREREAISAARLVDTCRLPLAVASDGQTAVVLDTRTGKKISKGIDSIPSKAELASRFADASLEPLPENKLERERLVFRTYDSMNVNVATEK